MALNTAQNYREGSTSLRNNTTHNPQHPSHNPIIGSAPPEARCRNKVLAALPQHSWERLTPYMYRVLLTEGQILQESDAQQQHVYFIEKGLASMIVNSRSGSQVESGVAGCESVIGAASLLTGQPSFHRVVVQIPGNAYKMPADVLRTEYRSNTVLQKLVQFSVHLEIVQSSQTAMCNRAHTVEERLSRWLLVTRDRIGANRLHVTHDMIAQALGARRSGVTVALGALQSGGMVDLARGHITVLDDHKLHGSACECYDVIQQQFQLLNNIPLV